MCTISLCRFSAFRLGLVIALCVCLSNVFVFVPLSLSHRVLLMCAALALPRIPFPAFTRTQRCIFFLWIERGTVRVSGQEGELWVWWLLSLRVRLWPVMLFTGTVCPVAQYGCRGAEYKADGEKNRHKPLSLSHRHLRHRHLQTHACVDGWMLSHCCHPAVLTGLFVCFALCA